MTVDHLLILGLASFRIARFVVLEDGPFEFMGRIRRRWQESALLHCLHCFGIYSSVLVVLIFIFFGANWLLLFLAVAGLVSLIRDMAMRP